MGSIAGDPVINTGVVRLLLWLELWLGLHGVHRLPRRLLVCGVHPQPNGALLAVAFRPLLAYCHTQRHRTHSYHSGSGRIRK